jgi:hypothetical protein
MDDIGPWADAVVMGTLAASARATASATVRFIFIGFAPFETFAEISPAHAKAFRIPYYRLFLRATWN